MDVEYLAAKALWVRQTALRMGYNGSGAHISTACSMAELTVALYQGGILDFYPETPKWDGRDRFILSKGQGALGLYPVLADAGYFPVDDLYRFCEKDSLLGVHSEHHCPGVEVITGSLGHGLGMSVGMALAARLDDKKHLVVCMVGDGELYEGSNWEAMFSAGHHRLGHLIVIVDANGQSTIGRLNDIQGANDGPRLEPLHSKFEAFRFEVKECDGHNFNDIFKVLDPRAIHARDLTRMPLCVIAHTVKGKGIKAMENQTFFPSHYRLPFGEDLKQALIDLHLDPDEFRATVGKEGNLGY